MSLKSHYRQQLTEQGFVLIHQKVVNFTAQTKSTAASPLNILKICQSG
jgi:hypothetical protein